MGTSAAIFLYEQTAGGVVKLHKIIYHTMDGYPWSVGLDLAKFLLKYYKDIRTSICLNDMLVEYERNFRDKRRKAISAILPFLDKGDDRSMAFLEEEIATKGLYFHDTDNTYADFHYKVIYDVEKRVFTIDDNSVEEFIGDYDNSEEYDDDDSDISSKKRKEPMS